MGKEASLYKRFPLYMPLVAVKDVNDTIRLCEAEAQEGEGGQSQYHLTKIMREIGAGRKVTCTKICYSPNGRWIAAGYSDGRIVMRDAKTYLRVWKRRVHKWCIDALMFDPHGAMVSSVSCGGIINLSARQGKQVGRFDCPKDYTACQCSETEMFFLVEETGLMIVDPWTGEKRRGPQGGCGPRGEKVVLDAVALCPGANLVAAADQEGNVHVSSYKRAGLTQFIPRGPVPRGQLPQSTSTFTHEDDVSALALSNSGDKLLCCLDTQEGYIWDVGSGRLEHVFAFTGDCVQCGFSPDDKTVVIATMTETGEESFSIWDAEKGQKVQSLASTEGNHWSAFSFSPDGGHLMITQARGTLAVAEHVPGQVVLEYHHRSPVLSFDLSVDQKQLVVITNKGNLILWDCVAAS